MNFPTWQIQFTSLLAGYDLQGYLTGNTPCPVQMIQSDNKQSLNPAYTFWQRQDKFLLHAIVASVTESIVPLIATAKTSQDAWEKLAKMFASKTRSRIMSLKKKLTVSHQEGRSVGDYLQFMKSIADELALAQAPVAEEDLVIFILNGLNSEFKEISTAIRARESDISFEELHDKLTDYEVVIKQEDLGNISTVTA